MCTCILLAAECGFTTQEPPSTSDLHHTWTNHTPATRESPLTGSRRLAKDKRGGVIRDHGQEPWLQLRKDTVGIWQDPTVSANQKLKLQRALAEDT